MKNEFLMKVFRWFALGLLVTFGVGWLVSNNMSLLSFVFSGATYWVIFILEIVLAIWLSARVHKMATRLALGLYFGYSALTGLTFSAIFIAYELESIIWIFLATSVVFGIFSVIGKNSKFDLRKVSTYLLVALLGIVILEVINIFFMNKTLDMLLCVVGLGVFVGYVAYDIRKILDCYSDTDNMAVIGAFDLYLDFINIFLRLLQLFGKERD